MQGEPRGFPPVRPLRDLSQEAEPLQPEQDEPAALYEHPAGNEQE